MIVVFPLFCNKNTRGNREKNSLNRFLKNILRANSAIRKCIIISLLDLIRSLGKMLSRGVNLYLPTWRNSSILYSPSLAICTYVCMMYVCPSPPLIVTCFCDMSHTESSSWDRKCVSPVTSNQPLAIILHPSIPLFQLLTTYRPEIFKILI